MFSSSDSNRVRSWLRLRPAVKSWIICSLLIIVLLSASICSIAYYFAWQAQKYDLSLVVTDTDRSSLYDENNKLIGYIDSDKHRLVRYEELPQTLINALLAREDDSFFTHGGVDYMSFLRSLLRNLKSMRYKQGGSTISMQLTRNVYELRAKSIERKLLEIALTMRLEQQYSKELILTQYFNRIYYGESCYGIADAAMYYFSKDVADLNLSECATLVGLVRGPSIFNPVADMAKATQVRNETLARMRIHEYITEAQYQHTLNHPIELKLNSNQLCSQSYPLMLVPEELKKFETMMSDDTGSIALVSSLNLDIQQMVESATAHTLRFIEGEAEMDSDWLEIASPDEDKHSALKTRWTTKLRRPSTLPKYGQDDLSQCLQCAVIVVDTRLNRKGSLLALIGGRDCSDGRNRWSHDVQLGEAAAPFLYSACLDSGNASLAIVPEKLRQTGRRVGYEPILRYYQQFHQFKNFASEEEADALYQGAVECSLLDLAQLYYSILHQGTDYKFDFTRFIYSQNRQLLYAYRVPERGELMRRENMRVVSTLPPFHLGDNDRRYANIILDKGCGQWTVVSNNKGVCVFVWMGFDETQTDMRVNSDLQEICSEFSLILAKQINQKACHILREETK